MPKANNMVDLAGCMVDGFDKLVNKTLGNAKSIDELKLQVGQLLLVQQAIIDRVQKLESSIYGEKK